MSKYSIYKTEDYSKWIESQTLKSRRQILSRLLKIEIEGHFGHHKDLKNGLHELKFNDGRRIYYALLKESNVILLLGGNKNGQDKDIKEASKILRKIDKLRS